MPYIDYINKDNTDYILSTANEVITCNSSASTQYKSLNVSDFPKGFIYQENGTWNITYNKMFKIKFTNGNTNSSPYTVIDINTTQSTIETLTLTYLGGYELEANRIYDCYIYDDGTSHTKIKIMNYDTVESRNSLNALTNKAITNLNCAVVPTFSGHGDAYYADVSIEGFPSSPFDGATIKLLSLTPFTAYDSTSSKKYLRINNNDNNRYPIEYSPYKDICTFYGNWNKNGTYSYRIWDSYTMLNLIYSSDSESWIISNNPLLFSYFSEKDNYVVYADGTMEQWGKRNYTEGTYTQDYYVFNFSLLVKFNSELTYIQRYMNDSNMNNNPVGSSNCDYKIDLTNHNLRTFLNFNLYWNADVYYYLKG